ncbi:LOW QUALITY PROTEIN: inactive phospholipase C-like protein 1 [Dermatophagoides farinae]|uniref:LOW QUALITY PROTEIN: inactive phospholipase C-like protein 1 n=1 Tax=Dermatophagoides farinae TaxID=6954 RepID=UPI003F626948
MKMSSKINDEDDDENMNNDDLSMTNHHSIILSANDEQQQQEPNSNCKIMMNNKSIISINHHNSPSKSLLSSSSSLNKSSSTTSSSSASSSSTSSSNPDQILNKEIFNFSNELNDYELHSSNNSNDNVKTTPQKTVCFHSVTGQPGSDKKITNAIDCLQNMINGTTLIKVKASMRQYRRFYSLEEDLTIIRWSPSTKKTSKAKLPIKSIREVRRGKNTDVLKNPEITGIYKEECSFSIIYGDDFESIDLIALSSVEANIWVTGLNFLIGLIRSPDSLEGREKMREKWLLDVFDEADSDHKGMLDELETIALLKKLNERLCIDSLKQKIMEFEMSKKNGEQRGCISKHAFISLFTQTATRPDIYFILVRYCGRDYMTMEELQLFLEGEQAIQGTSLELCKNLIKRFEPSDQARNKQQLLIDGFTQFLMSDACDILGLAPKQISHNMNRPFVDYFISSSYNTYLIEDQVKGPSSCEGYTKALLSGCRCIKIDVHDGPDYCPLVFHRNTLTSKIPLMDVLTTIKEMAFISSPYPVIIHLENHCSLNVQKEVARLFRKILADHLFLLSTSSLDIMNNGGESSSSSSLLSMKFKMETMSLSSNSSSDDYMAIDMQHSNASSSEKYLNTICDQFALNSSTMATNIWSKLTPEKLMYKIIISGKKIGNKNRIIDEVSDEEEENHDFRNDDAHKPRIAICQELSEIISMNRVKPKDNNNCDDNNWSNFDNSNLIHLNESLAVKIAQQNIEELTQRNKYFMTMVTPDISRIDSSNLNPLDFWNCGVQLISMNYQTNGQIMNIYRGWFSQNGCCGYVLKPTYLRGKYSTFNLRRKDAIISGVDPLNIRIKIISGQQLPRPKGASMKANSIDPYIIVQCLGTSIDCAEYRTSTVSNDGHNPIFDESFEFNVCLPELTMIRFLVLDDDYINDDFIGQLAVPISCLESGYKHIKLLNMNDKLIPNASLFVKIALTQRYGSKQKLRRKKSWSQKHNHDAKQMGVKHLDEQLKQVFAMMNESSLLRKNIEKNYIELCDECSLPESANMAQCLRIITLRLATCPTVIGFKIVTSELGYPCVQVCGELTTRLNRTITTLDRCLLELFKTIDQSKNYIASLSELFEKLSNVNYQYEGVVDKSNDSNQMLQYFLNSPSSSSKKTINK